MVGVGSAWRCDDRAGLELARRLRKARLPGVRIVEEEGEPTSLLDDWRGAERAVVVDAVSSGSPPGVIHRFDAVAGQLPAERFAGSTHAFSVADAIELARSLGRLPQQLTVYGIEGLRFDAGDQLSPEVDRAVRRLAGELRRELQAAER